jgi:formate dehydrogenase iron-sulfur subunit
MCSDRVAVNQAPACAKACPTGAIQFGAKEDMKDYADQRIADLKERGFEKAGLYDPQGVGGTHVMYVLHHADQPKLYADLPENPGVSPMVELWKGATKPLATLALAGVALGSLLHYVTKGPNEVSKEIEDEIEREDQEASK